ncbi:endo-beta-N-acetylglucosaminidase [Bacillaceae bacterium SIJ1]|uniref:endo-beta-N-acetylglucosaminidase n=1 Tax=Litoribacterium kuwaitense TaxID=1398745 RepID=UPI0013EB0822|nr:endo-beta-N-acetylglucosaminidase [Litoribacterium kuwaitense]NGP46437.1 endo-beta-N-acetylglucosaminidase [Litoribacterium kuwaitense]
MKRKCALLATALFMTFPHITEASMHPTGDAVFAENQPVTHGYRAIDIEHWSPETDPDAERLRAFVPLQERNEPFAATQANPSLSPDTEFFNLNGDYDFYFLGGTPYNNEFSKYLFNFWQYTDYYGGWHGTATADVPDHLYNPDGPSAFEFGIVEIPNPAYTNAAHKNGAKSVGTIYIPRAGQPYDLILKQRDDGTFPIAEKLIEMKEYFGFDGYFINQETAIKPSDIDKYKAFTKTLIDAGVYTQWYDTIDDQTGSLSYQPSLLPSHSSFVRDDDIGGMVNSSIFMNYNWNSPDGWNNGDSTDQTYIKNTVAEAERRGIDPLKTVFSGIEAGLGQFSGSHNSTRNADVILDKETGNPLTSLATLGGNFVQTGLKQRAEDDDQWMIAERERMWYTGVKIDPTDTEEQKGYARPDVGVDDASEWTGISRYIAERSVIDGSTFATNFNTGHGMEYYVNGQVSNDEQWSNINVQDILPTWQWWVETDGTKLQVDFDYGNSVENGDKFTYKQIGAYQGGSSLVVNGTLDAKNVVRLYKTDINVTNQSTASLTFNKITAPDHSEIQFALIFKDAPDQVEYLPIPNSGAKTNGFTTADLDVSHFAGREIAALGLAFDPKGEAIDQYQVNIGELKITDGKEYTPSQPAGFKIKHKYNTNEVDVVWDREDYDTVEQYNVYAQLKNGKNVFLGGVYGEHFYIKNLDKRTTALKLTAVGKDNTESAPAIISLNKTDYFATFNVDETDTGFDIEWKRKYPDVSEYAFDLRFTDGRTDVYTKTVAEAEKATAFQVPVQDDDRYLLEVSALDENSDVLDTISFTGKMKDSYSEPFDGSYYIDDDTLGIDVPSSDDWWHMYVTIDGEPVQPQNAFNDVMTDYFIRGFHDLHGLELPEDGAVIGIALEDYAGNMSEVKNIVFERDN